jgi:uncharacterized protein
VKIDLSKLEGEPIRFAETVRLDADRLDPTRVAGPIEVRLEGSVRPVDDRFLVAGQAVATGRLACGRCLEPVDWASEEAFDLEVALSDAAPLDSEIVLDESDLDIVYLDNPALDLDELAAEQVMLALPMRVLCADDCAGLCPRCGANRNVDGACRCEPDTDPRWSALGDLAGGAPVD